ncbi:MAG: ComF family protein [Candidatus Hodarchaeales archaeon]
MKKSGTYLNQIVESTCHYIKEHYSDIVSDINYIAYVPGFKKDSTSIYYYKERDLALAISRNLSIPLVNDLFTKIKNIKQSETDSRKQRRKNAEESYILNESGWFQSPLKKIVKERPVSLLIVDDITTTGSTLDVLAGLVKNQDTRGLLRVYGLVIGRAREVPF